MRDSDVLLEMYTAGVIDRLGKDTTPSTSELRDYGVRNFSPTAFVGVYPADITPERTRHKCFLEKWGEDSVMCQRNVNMEGQWTGKHL